MEFKGFIFTKKIARPLSDKAEVGRSETKRTQEYGGDYADPLGERRNLGPSTLVTEGLFAYKKILLYKYFENV